MSENPVRVVYEGRTDPHHYGSWALVNQRLQAALAQLAFEGRLDLKLQTVPPNTVYVDQSDVWLSHYYPGLEPGGDGAGFALPPQRAGKWVCWVAWEFGPVPESWERAWRVGRVHEVWASSAHSRRLILGSTELDPAKVRVVPYGVDTSVFRRDQTPWEVADPATFRVLYVGGAIKRKGADVVIDGYTRAFTPEEPTRLVLKLQGQQTFYRNQPALSAPQGRDDYQVLANDAYTDAQLAGLYVAVDAVCQPYRAEGFCLPLLEAMASGRPVVYPAHGPAPEFVPPDAGIAVPVKGLTPDPVAVARALRWLWLHPDARELMGRAGRDAARRYAWTERAEDVAAQLTRVAAEPDADAFGPPLPGEAEAAEEQVQQAVGAQRPEE